MRRAPALRVPAFARLAWIADPRRRRMRFALVAGVLAVLALVPQPYKELASLTAIEQTADKLAPAMSAFSSGSIASVLAGSGVSEYHLRVGRSVDVRKAVLAQIPAKEVCPFSFSERAALNCLDGAVTVRIVRGNMLLIETRNHDTDLGVRLVAAYVAALQNRLKELAWQQTEIKRQVVLDRYADAEQRLKSAQDKLDGFRRAHNIPDPINAIGLASNELPALRERLRTLEMQLAVTREFQTDGNYAVQTLQAQIAEVRHQMALAEASDPKDGGSVAALVGQSTEYESLLREVRYARTLFDWYVKVNETTSVEDLVAKITLRTIEPAHVDPSLQFNYLPLVLFVLWLSLLAALEFEIIEPPRVRDGG